MNPFDTVPSPGPAETVDTAIRTSAAAKGIVVCIVGDERHHLLLRDRAWEWDDARVPSTMAGHYAREYRAGGLEPWLIRLVLPVVVLKP